MLIKSNPSVEGPVGIASLAVVEFPNNAAFDKWSSEAASKLDTDLIVRRADLLVDDRAKTVAKNLAYVVSRYGAAYTGQGIYRLYQSLYHA